MIREIVGEKECSKCNKIKSYGEFHRRNSKNNFSLYSWCKLCHAKHQKEIHKKDNKSRNKRIQELRKIKRNELKKIIVAHLKNNPCKTCGEKDIVVLEFNHRDSKNKEFCISQARTIVPSVKRLTMEMAKCDVLCANCHRRKTAKERNYNGSIS